METKDCIKPYSDEEVNAVLKDFREHPFMKTLTTFAFPGQSDDVIDDVLDNCHSIDDLQVRVCTLAVQRVMDMTSRGFSSNGENELVKGVPYTYISNHRDIILDASLLNIILKSADLVMTASAIGDNLVDRDSLLTLSRLNRNFTIRRNLQPREFLEHSKQVSKYISKLLKEGRSVWLAQREGRAKDGNDETQQGILKMLSMSKQKGESLVDCFVRLNIVPVAVSYEFDPTDILKLPELVAKDMGAGYKKKRNEDFSTIIKGFMGQKGRINISITKPISSKIRSLVPTKIPINDQIQHIKTIIDDQIHSGYKLWSSNYIAYDMLCGENNSDKYYEEERKQFEHRIERRLKSGGRLEREIFLRMYANPVINAKKASKLQIQHDLITTPDD